MTEPIADEAERIVRLLASELTDPRPEECLCCYVARQLQQYGCDGTHRFAEHFRDTTAPRATALRRRLSAAGACCCDCELFLNAYTRRPPVDGAPAGPERRELPACAGVRRGSVQPCSDWVRWRRRF